MRISFGKPLLGTKQCENDILHVASGGIVERNTIDMNPVMVQIRQASSIVFWNLSSLPLGDGGLGCHLSY
jgi:hypothetical protein